MLDFTSALYLGLRHASDELPPWAQLTTGVPAALDEPERVRAVAAGLARLQGLERGLLATSTLHLYWDLLALLAEPGTTILLDAGAYPVARWGAERAAARGASARTFAHHDPDALRLAARRARRPVIVCDGLCPSCGRPAPLAAYREVAARAGGRLVVDDTQALGILGPRPGPDHPYGRGGGGSLRRAGAAGPEVIAASSLAKAFGAPVALLAGPEAAVRRFAARSGTRVHSSPPSLAAVAAAERALALNAREGDERRRRLAARVRAFRRRLAEAGLAAAGGLFPVQTLERPAGPAAAALHLRLLRSGVRTVLHRDRGGRGVRLSLLIRADHAHDDVLAAADAVAAALAAPLRAAG